MFARTLTVEKGHGKWPDDFVIPMSFRSLDRGRIRTEKSLFILSQKEWNDTTGLATLLGQIFILLKTTTSSETARRAEWQR